MIYFISDTHLGLEYCTHSSKEREKHLCNFLDSIKDKCDELFLLGDIFDFWFEWNRTVPKGFVRILAKLQEFTESGIPVHFFTGNHDLWVGDYLNKEIGITIHIGSAVIERQGKKLFLSHGDTQYKNRGFSRFLEIVLRSKLARWIGQRIIHPDFMLRLGQGWSKSNRKKKGDVAHIFTGQSDNWVKVSKEILKGDPNIDYFIYGHLHCQVLYDLDVNKKMMVLGEWIERPAYGTLNQGEIELFNYPFTDINNV